MRYGLILIVFFCVLACVLMRWFGISTNSVYDICMFGITTRSRHMFHAAPVSGPLLSHLGSPPSNPRGWANSGRDPTIPNHPKAPKQLPASPLLRNRVRRDRTLENGMGPSSRYAHPQTQPIHLVHSTTNIQQPTKANQPSN